MINIVRYSKEEVTRWNDFVSQSLNGNFMYNRKYLDYHSHKFTDHSLFAFKGKKLKAIIPMNETGDEIHSHQGITYGGWLTVKRFSAEETQELFKAFELYCSQMGFKSISYKQKPLFFSNHFSDADSWVMWNRSWNLYRRDLSFGIDMQNLPGFARDKRYRLNKSARNDLRIDWNASIEVYMTLVRENLISRFGVEPVHTIEEVERLQGLFPKNIKTIAVYSQDEFLGGTWLFEDNQFIHTQYLHTNSKGKELCAVEFLIDNLISKYKNSKRWLSFGVSTEEGGKVLNKGLSSFKEGFGAAGFIHDFYKRELKS